MDELGAPIAVLALRSIVLVVSHLHCNLAGAGHCCRPGKLILGLPVRGRCVVDQEPVRDRIGFRITGLCRPGNCGSQDLWALLVCGQAR